MAIVGKVSIYEKFMRGLAKVGRVRLTFQGGATIQPDHYGPANVDSPPMDGDYAVAVDTEGTGARADVGYLDPANAQNAAQGEFRAYARDPSSKAQVVELWLKGDGSAKLSNASGYIELLANGSVVINGAIIGTDGNVTTAAGVSLDDHVHSFEYTDTGNPLPNPQTGTTDEPTV